MFAISSLPGEAAQSRVAAVPGDIGATYPANLRAVVLPLKPRSPFTKVPHTALPLAVEEPLVCLAVRLSLQPLQAQEAEREATRLPLRGLLEAAEAAQDVAGPLVVRQVRQDRATTAAEAVAFHGVEQAVAAVPVKPGVTASVGVVLRNAAARVATALVHLSPDQPSQEAAVVEAALREQAAAVSREQEALGAAALATMAAQPGQAPRIPEAVVVAAVRQVAQAVLAWSFCLFLTPTPRLSLLASPRPQQPLAVAASTPSRLPVLMTP